MKRFANDLCLQIAASKPLYVAPEDVDQNFLNKEREIIKAQLADSGKNEKVLNQIIEGKMFKNIFRSLPLKQSL